MILFNLIQMPLVGRRISSPARPSSSLFWLDSTQKCLRMQERMVFSSIMANFWPSNECKYFSDRSQRWKPQIQLEEASNWYFHNGPWESQNHLGCLLKMKIPECLSLLPPSASEQLGWSRYLYFSKTPDKSWAHSSMRITTQSTLLLDLHFFLFCFFFFKGCISGIWRFPGQGSNQSYSWGARQHYSNARSKPHLQPTPQLTAMPDS